MKGRVYEVSLGRRGRISDGEGGRGRRRCCLTASQILRAPGFSFCLRGGVPARVGRRIEVEDKEVVACERFCDQGTPCLRKCTRCLRVN